MPIGASNDNTFTNLTRDGVLLFLTRFTRLFAYGALSVVLVLYLIGLGFSESQTGMLLTLTLIGDTFVSLFLTTRADRMGRRLMLIIGALLMASAGLAFASTANLLLLTIAGTIGVVSPSGNEVGPFLSIEQAALSHVVPSRIRTPVFAWYTLAGSFATAIGSLCGGLLPSVLRRTTITPVGSYRAVVILYAIVGILLALLFTRYPNEDHCIPYGPLLAEVVGDVVLPLLVVELVNRYVFPLRQLSHGLAEFLGHLSQHHWRWNWFAQLVALEHRQLGASCQPADIAVEVKTVEALHFQCNVPVKEFRNGCHPRIL